MAQRHTNHLWLWDPNGQMTFEQVLAQWPRTRWYPWGIYGARFDKRFGKYLAEKQIQKWQAAAQAGDAKSEQHM